MTNLRKEWWKIIALIIAGAINALGVVTFLYPASILDGGISGLSVLLAKLTPLSLAVYIAIINIPFFVIGFKKMGLKFILCSIIAISSYSLFAFLFDKIADIGNIMFKLINGDFLLCTVFGGLISGIGSGLTIKLGGAIDGVEVMAVMFAKKLSLTIGQFVMVFNVVLYVIACFLLKNFQIGLYSIITYGIGVKTIDFIVDGINKGKACIIITNHASKIANEVSSKMGRGITLINSKGYYSGEDKIMMYCVVNRFEIGKIKGIISDIDKDAFVTITDISEVLGSTKRYGTKNIDETIIQEIADSDYNENQNDVSIDNEEIKCDNTGSNVGDNDLKNADGQANIDNKNQE